MPTTEKDWTIVRGKGWGPLVIGAELAAVERALGKAAVESFRKDGFYVARWFKRGVEAYLTLGKKVQSIVFKYADTEYSPFAGATAEGISARSTMNDVEAGYGPPPERRGRAGGGLVYDGLFFYFDKKKLEDITIDPSQKPKEGPAAKKALPPLKKEQTALENKVMQLVAKLEERVAALADKKIRVVFSPVGAGDVEAWEQQQGRRLPPSYRRLILEKGTLHVRVHDYKTFWMFPFDDLGVESPNDWAGEGDDAIDDAVAKAIYFAYENDDSVENYIAFNPRATDKDGEMGVVNYYHDEELRLGTKVARTFADYVEEQTAELFDDFIPAVLGAPSAAAKKAKKAKKSSR